MIKTNDLIKSVDMMICDALENEQYQFGVTDDEDQRQLFQDKDKAIFFIDVHIAKSESVNLHFNKKNVDVNIRFYPNSKYKKRDLYNIKDILDAKFIRSIKVGNRYIHIDEVNSFIMRDQVGFWINYDISLSYHEQVYFDIDDSELMGKLNIEYGDNLRVNGEMKESED